MKKILVTGAAGLIGYEICKQLSKSPINYVVAVDNFSRGKTIPKCNEFLEIDLTNKDQLKKLSNDFNYIYHYGAINGTSNFYKNPNLVLTNNFIVDVNMFEFAETCKNLQKFAYASSSELMSDYPSSPLPEATDIIVKNIHNPRWCYRLEKICAENYLVNSKLPYMIFRYFNVYGKDSKPGHFVCDQITKIKNNVFELIGPNETRSFCLVDDAVSATIFCTINCLNDVVNIGNDKEITILDAANIIAKHMGHENVKWTVKESLQGSTSNRRPDIIKLKSLMKKYDPVSFDTAIKTIIKDLI